MRARRAPHATCCDLCAASPPGSSAPAGGRRTATCHRPGCCRSSSHRRGSWPQVCRVRSVGSAPRIPLSPPLRRRPQDMEDLSSVSNRPPLINDQPHDAQPLNRSKNSISVKHEDLRTEPRELDNSTLHRKSSSFQDLTHQPTYLGTTTRTEMSAR